MGLVRNNLEGWNCTEDQHGFVLFTKEGFDGCIRQNTVNGTAEVFSDHTPFIDPTNVETLIFSEMGAMGSDGKEELERAVLAVDTVQLAEKKWFDSEDGKELVEKMFETAGLPEVDERDLEVGTYTNRQIAEMVEDPVRLEILLMTLPEGSDFSSKRSILSFAIEMIQDE